MDSSDAANLDLSKLSDKYAARPSGCEDIAWNNNHAI